MPASFRDYTVSEPDLERTREQYAALAERLASAASADECLKIIADWDALSCEFKEWASLTYIRFSQDTNNKEYEAEKKRLDEVQPKFVDLETTFKKALLDSPFRSEIEASTGEQLFAKWQCNTRSFSPAIEADLTAESALQSKFTALTARGKIQFRGQDYTISEIRKFYDNADRETREASYRATSQWYADNAPALDKIYDQQVKLRDSMAEKLGYETFTELGYQRMSRIGYGPEEVATFRQEVRDKVVPLAVEIAESQAEVLGVDPLMFWDASVYSKEGNPAPLGDHDWMIDRATEMFAEMGHGLDTLFDEMKARGLMDLKSREGKAGGGYCDFLTQFGFPFIFANFNGTRGDVDVFTHEMGHAFQGYSSRQALSDLIWPTTEACEIHSMSLEFLCWPHMNKFYGEEAAENLRRTLLKIYVHFLPYGVSIDHFQHMVYENPSATPEERNEMWKEIEATYLPWYRYADLPHEASGRLWQQKQHIYLCPFYYVDYCLAATGALQFWSRSRRDVEGTLDAYAKLCALGGTQNYTGLMASAGLNSPFQEGCLDAVLKDVKGYLQ